MGKLLIGIVGCGNIGNRHALQAAKVGVVKAVCDIVIDKANSLAEKLKCKAYDDIRQLIAKSNLDLIAICTPNYLHAQQSILCLRNGSNVLCEKPMALTSNDAIQMAATAEITGKKLFVVKQNRYNPPVAYVKKLIDSNSLGMIYSFHINGFWNRPNDYYKNWKGKKQLDGGTLFTQFSHFIDLLIWFFGDVLEVQCMKNNVAHPSVEFEDQGIINFKMMSGAIGNFSYSVNTYEKNMEGSITIIAEKGTIKIGGQYLNELEYFNVKGIAKPTLPIGNGANLYGTYQGSMSNHDKIYENVTLALSDPSNPFLEALEGIKTIEVIEKIYNCE